HTRGCGIMNRYRAFFWDKGLKGIENPDPIKLEDLVGYEYQKEILTGNTEAFLRGKKANNILLYGEKGTGKSSSVKALLNKYTGQGLRMIELGKKQLLDFPRVVETVRNRGMYFIIFIDDLSFEDFEVEYKEIKASIDGSLQARPDNVLLYVTSNRRHLIRENWSDRKPSGEEIHISDTFQEKLSFADRFGIMISYQSPNQDEYLQIINELARKNNVTIPPEELKKLAIQWERKYHGRSGRTARQFINHIASSI
ncbi:MAG: ATP-binding protein, partial [Syntrophomonas sp.]